MRQQKVSHGADFTKASYTKPVETEPQPSIDLPTKVDSPQPIVVPADTDSSDPNDYYQWPPSVLALKARLSDGPAKIYTFGSDLAFVTEHVLTQTQGQAVDDYEGFDLASFQHSHFVTVINPDAAAAVVSGSVGFCIMYIIGASSKEATFACFRYLQSADPGLQIGAP